MPESVTFEEVYNSFHKPIYSFAYSLLHDRGLTEEAVQEIFTLIYKNMDKINSVSRDKLRPYLLAIARNLCYTYMKKEIQDQGKLISIDESAKQHIANDDLWSDVSYSLLYDELKVAISELRQREKDILRLRVLMNMTYKEIAEIMKTTEKSISVEISRIRKKLKNNISLYKEVL